MDNSTTKIVKHDESVAYLLIGSFFFLFAIAFVGLLGIF